MKKISLMILVPLIASSATGQFEVSAELRPRLEVRHGYRLLPHAGDAPAVFTSQRTRLNLGFRNDRLAIRMSVQDVRVWGDEQLYSSTGVFGDQASVDLKEGWMEVVLSNRTALRIGRQFLSYDDERLLARRNWNQNAITYDAVLCKYSHHGLTLHLGASLNNNSENTFGGDYNLYREVILLDTATGTIVTRKVALEPRIRSLDFLYVSKELGKGALSFLAMATGVQNPLSSGVVYVKGTYGLSYRLRTDLALVRLSSYYQHGSNCSGLRVSAYMLNAYALYRVGKVSVNGGIDYISGQDGLNNAPGYLSKDHFFDIFYGARHKYYGLMDYFSAMRSATAGGGLVDLMAGAGYAPATKLVIQLDGHYFLLQNRVPDPTAENGAALALDKGLAAEADLSLVFNWLPDLKVEGGFSVMLPGESMEKIQHFDDGGSRFSYWGWVMLTATPELFRSGN